MWEENFRFFFPILKKKRKKMPELGNNKSPFILKNKKKGNRKLISARSKMTDQERKTYNKNWDKIFGKSQKNYNRQKS